MNLEDQLNVAMLYEECENEWQKKTCIAELADFYGLQEYNIRQVLIEQKVYAEKTKSEKEQYATALWAVTDIEESEWAKLKVKTLKKIMAIFQRNQE
tara:strand:- start:216 stop:506 length:291 start_codon:yes stop_codon:yes gene_type:complete